MVLKAYDGLQALDILSTQQVRLVLIDVMMPKLDGLSAVMRIREKQNIPIIVLSAKSEDTDKVLGLSMGADDYVSKPYNPQELAARVKASFAGTRCWETSMPEAARKRSKMDGFCTALRKKPSMQTGSP